MQSLLVGSDPHDMKMLKLPPIMHGYRCGYSCLTLVGDHISIVALMSSRSWATQPNTLCVLGFSSISDSWIELAQLNLDYSSIPSVVDHPNGKLLLMGMKDTQFAPLSQFGMNEVTPNGMLRIFLCTFGESV